MLWTQGVGSQVEQHGHEGDEATKINCRDEPDLPPYPSCLEISSSRRRTKLCAGCEYIRAGWRVELANYKISSSGRGKVGGHAGESRQVLAVVDP